MSLNNLESTMRLKVPNASLVVQSLPLVPEIRLALIDSAYPQDKLTQSQIEHLMDEPPYWAFCWASGQVLARYLLDHPEQVRGKQVVDFGCGSGVVAIAAKMAGASHCIGLDIDHSALLASKFNANLNQVSLELKAELKQQDIDHSNAVLLIADVFYDRNNIPLLTGFLADYHQVIVADSRVKPEELPGVHEQFRCSSHTVPDLAEASSFNSVGIYS